MGSHQETLAERLYEAERLRNPVSPLSDEEPSLTVADAYAIQRLNVERRVATGRVLRGHKVGLTSAAMQQLLGVSEPDFGILLDDMFVEDGSHISARELIQPKVEAEVAFLLGEDLVGPGVTTVGALRAIAGAMPSLEIIDSRIIDWRIRLVDTIADNASSARVVLGGKLTPLGGIDLRLIGVALSRNGECSETGAGAAALGNPATCVAWLANKLAEFGDGLRAGDVILPGALHRAADATAGDVFRADFAYLGSVAVRFAHVEEGVA